MKIVNGFIKIIRPLNCTITLFTVVVGVLICAPSQLITWEMNLAAVVGFLITAAGNAINDYYDIEIDNINRQNRPLPSELLTKRSVLVFFYVITSISVVLSLSINLNSFLITFSSAVLLFLYSYKFKRVILLGNFMVSLLTALAFIFAGTVVENVSPAIVPAVFAFLINFIRELIKDMEDKEGDAFAGLETFPIKYGNQSTQNLARILALVLFLFTFIPFLLRIYKIEYFLLVMVIINPILFYAMKLLSEDSSKKNLGRISSLLKFDMIAGLIAIYLGK